MSKIETVNQIQMVFIETFTPESKTSDMEMQKLQIAEYINWSQNWRVQVGHRNLRFLID